MTGLAAALRKQIRDDAPSGTRRATTRCGSQDVAAWSPYAARPSVVGKDTRRLACEQRGTPHENFSAAITASPVQRAKARGGQRSTSVVLGNVGTAAVVTLLTQALNDPQLSVRAHATWALD